MYSNDNRIVMTLDAGGTNLVFSAIRRGDEIVTPITLPSCACDLDHCLGQLATGFTRIREATAGAAGRYQLRFSRSGRLSGRYHR